MENLKYLLITSVFVSIFSCSGKQNNEKYSENEDNNINIHENNQSQLNIDGFYFAKRKEKGVSRVDPPVFQRGEEVYLVLQHVGKFRRGDDSLNHVEFHMTVTNSLGEVIVDKNNILGSKGKKDLKNNILNNPFATYKTLLSEKPGTYHFKLTVRDLISLDSSVTEADYFLE
jgi:hypothetical protein